MLTQADNQVNQKDVMEKIDISTYNIIMSFPVLYDGWEMDNRGHVLEKDGEVCLALSSHGRFYKAPHSDLTAKMDEYQAAIDQSTKALKMLLCYKGTTI